MTNKNAYLLIFRGNDWHKGLSPEEMQRISDQWMAWFKGLTDDGRAIAGNPLEPRGKIVSGANGRMVVDGPFAESKEAVGGYFLLQVSGLDEAVAIAKECPGLPYGAKIEVRPVMEKCSMSGEGQVQSRMAEAVA
ncbi:MAG TPA: YciI family protein [Candidatus Acidoferrales bacterium]|nr:YciI family protein [Candidatus Acidoferrales bacterium]